MKPKPKFESNADATLDRVRATYAQRGGEYADTWGTCRFHVMMSVAKELGSTISPQHFRALASAALCDMKNERMTGGWKEDNMIDGIAYDAFLVEEMRMLKNPGAVYWSEAPAIERAPDGEGGEEKWRILEKGERVGPEDEFTDGHGWRAVSSHGMINVRSGAFRRRVS